jgi:hypothetical protein
LNVIEVIQPLTKFHCCLVLLLANGIVFQVHAEQAFHPMALRLRQEFNQVSAAIDTVVRRYGDEQIKKVAENLTQPKVNLKTVLIFWADDEAEVYLNDHPVGSTRLTPKRIEIPAMYLRAHNILRVDGWDTDRVESGFMAGFYLEGQQGRLHPILLTGDKAWRTPDGMAEERFYTHTVPDIPGALVIWGPSLFGEVHFQAEFSLQAVQQAHRRQAVAPPKNPGLSETMEMHQVVSRLVDLQERRKGLSARLKTMHGETPSIYRGKLTSPLAYTLGKAAPLSESESIEAANRVRDWTRTLPPVQQELVWQEGRRLKGAQAATASKETKGGVGGVLDRRKEYQAPPENGPGQDGERRPGGSPANQGQGRFSGQVLVGSGPHWTWWVLIAGLTVYLGGMGRQWWKVFSGKGWRL